MTGPAVVLLALALALGGAVLDGLTGTGLRSGFAVAFIAGCVLAALLVRRRDLAVAAVMPPLLYLAVVLLSGTVAGSSSGGSWLVRKAMDLFTALVLEAPALLVASGAALVITLARGLARSRALATR